MDVKIIMANIHPNDPLCTEVISPVGIWSLDDIEACSTGYETDLKNAQEKYGVENV